MLLDADFCDVFRLSLQQASGLWRAYHTEHWYHSRAKRPGPSPVIEIQASLAGATREEHLGRAGVGTMEEMTFCMREERIIFGASVNVLSCKQLNRVPILPIHVFDFRSRMGRAYLRGRLVIGPVYRREMPFRPPTEMIDQTVDEPMPAPAGQMSGLMEIPAADTSARDPLNINPTLDKQAPGSAGLGSRLSLPQSRDVPPSSPETEWHSQLSFDSAMVFPEPMGSPASDEEMDLDTGEADHLSQVSTVSFVRSAGDELSEGELESSMDRTNDPSANPSPASEADFPRSLGAEISVARHLSAPWWANEPVAEYKEQGTAAPPPGDYPTTTPVSAADDWVAPPSSVHPGQPKQQE